jgi:hypothetical protein
MPLTSRPGIAGTKDLAHRRRWLVVLGALGCLGTDPGVVHAGDPPRIASRANGTLPQKAASAPAATQAEEHPVTQARRMIGECQTRFADVRDYTCTFHKRERVDGELTAPYAMMLKARNQPLSLYFKFHRPNKGREAIYVAGRNGGRVLAHDVGLGRILAGTMRLDPRGSMAMEGTRHPISEAGLGNLIDTVARHWNRELTPEESVVHIDPNMQIGVISCTMIESIHPAKKPEFLFHKVRLFIDREHGLPIRFEAYDWPKQPGAAPELMEEYTYMDLKLNVGLTELDFDPSNKAYAFGRF